MESQIIQRVYRLAILILVCAVVFFMFFQMSKNGPFRAINPFGNDPYDAVGSIAIQVAQVSGWLTFARALRLREDPGQLRKLRLIAHGCYLTLLVILVTLATDVIAEIASPASQSAWASILRWELAGMLTITLIGGIETLRVFLPLHTESPPEDLTLADGIDDLWAVVRLLVRWARRFIPDDLAKWVLHASSDQVFSYASWIDPRRHPWRFAVGLGLLTGVGLLLAQLIEGLPPNLNTGLLIVGIFTGAELTAILLGYTLLGGYLGLRPVHRERKNAL